MGILLKHESRATFEFFRPPNSLESVRSKSCDKEFADHFLFSTTNSDHQFWVGVERDGADYRLKPVDGDSESPGIFSMKDSRFLTEAFRVHPLLASADGIHSQLIKLDDQRFSFWYFQRRVFAVPAGTPFRREGTKGEIANLVWEVSKSVFSKFEKVSPIKLKDSNDSTTSRVHLNRVKSDSTSFYLETESYLSSQAHLIGKAENQSFWLFGKKLFSSFDLDLSAEDVAALANEERNKRRLQLEKAHALESMTKQLDSRAKRQTISQDVKTAVWQRDQSRCVECESQVSLEFDHIIPFSMGGSNTVRNLQLLCESCNRRKGATLG
jgi:hypothetical protein